MKNFLAVFTGTAEAVERLGWSALTAAEREQRTAEGMHAWQSWMDTHRSETVFVGGPLGKTLRVSKAGVVDAKNDLCGYVVVCAETHQEAAALFVDHPHFSIFPGEAVEVLECLPVPSAAER